MRIKRLLKVSNSSVYKTSGPIRASFISHNEKRLSTKHLVNATIWHFQEIFQRHIQFKFDNEQLAEVFMRPEDLQYSKKKLWSSSETLRLLYAANWDTAWDT